MTVLSVKSNDCLVVYLLWSPKIVIEKFLGPYDDMIKAYEVPLSRMISKILDCNCMSASSKRETEEIWPSHMTRGPYTDRTVMKKSNIIWYNVVTK